jgi:hypothetical protein
MSGNTNRLAESLQGVWEVAEETASGAVSESAATEQQLATTADRYSRHRRSGPLLYALFHSRSMPHEKAVKAFALTASTGCIILPIS